ncbi:MAG: alpha/beta hydrolase [ANME-2 cluster archaeon]|nr:alpha/beta hydrolase [ANME-2 cluster archaeon]MDF1532225.1 alpha/beta hydrolase [ANME-2 cluster archaeon]
MSIPAIEVNDTTLYYEVRGKGNPMYVLHGGPGLDHRYFGRSLSGLENIRELYYIDFRGHGKSSKTDVKTYTLETFVDDIDAIRMHLWHDSIEILGHSMGGMVGLLYALHYPAYLEKLILVGTPAKHTKVKGYYALKAALLAVNLKYYLQYQKDKTIDMEAFAREILLKSWPIYIPEKMLLDYTDYIRSLQGLDIFFDMQDELELFDFSEEVFNIIQPTLIIFGENDPFKEGGKLLKNIKESRFSVIPETKHMPFLEDEMYFNIVVREFLTGKIL